jgi:hypothetical protein
MTMEVQTTLEAVRIRATETLTRARGALEAWGGATWTRTRGVLVPLGRRAEAGLDEALAGVGLVRAARMPHPSATPEGAVTQGVVPSAEPSAVASTEGSETKVATVPVEAEGVFEASVAGQSPEEAPAGDEGGVGEPAARRRRKN